MDYNFLLPYWVGFLFRSWRVTCFHALNAACGAGGQETSKEIELQCPRKDFSCAVQEYAVRFLKYNNSLVPLRLAEVPATSDRVSDLGNQEMCWENNFIEVWTDS